MINHSFSFIHLFHAVDSLSYRKQLYRQYAKKYNVRLYRLRVGFAFPEVLFKTQYADQDFSHADGLVVGDKPTENHDPILSKTENAGFYQLAHTLRSGANACPMDTDH